MKAKIGAEPGKRVVVMKKISRRQFLQLCAGMALLGGGGWAFSRGLVLPEVRDKAAAVKVDNFSVWAVSDLLLCYGEEQEGGDAAALADAVLASAGEGAAPSSSAT